MNLVKVRNKVSKNGFDLSRKNGFTAKAGEILPFLTLHTLPNSEYEINISSFTRTMPLNTPAFVRIKEYYDFYFVPYRLLYRYAPQMFAQTNEQNFATSATQNNYIGTEFPYITSYELNATYYNGTFDGNPLDAAGFSFSYGFNKLLQYLDYGDISSFDNANYQVPLNIFPLLAYQKIYMDYFRNSQWESVEPRSFNIDYISPGTSLNEGNFLSPDDFAKCFQLRYCNYPADMFTGLLPNTQYGDVSTVDVGNVSLNDNLTFRYGIYDADNNGELGTPLGEGSSYDTGVTMRDGKFYETKGNILGSLINLKHDTNFPSFNASFSILQLRKAQALQRYNEVAQTWDKDYSGQMAAHYGANVPSGLSMRSLYLGGSDNVIQIGDVVNTNLFGGQESSNKFDVGQAEMKGKGTGVNNGKIHFKCEEHGIIMGVYHALPLLDYVPVGCDEFNFKTDVLDYAIPEFDTVGMQPLYGRSLLFQPTGNVDLVTKILGYAPRYIEYKTAVDKVHGAFYDGGLEAWYTALLSQKIDGYVKPDPSAFDSYSLQKVTPDIFNSIFSFDATESTSSDALLVNCFMDIKAVLPLDRNGLPF